MNSTMDKQSKILITGGTGLVGTALSKVLTEEGYKSVIITEKNDCDLMSSQEVEKMFKDKAPDYVFHLAARVHGIGGNKKYKSDVLFENVMINTNLIENARKAGVKKIVAMGSGCVYPELPEIEELREEHIWIGSPHPSEDSYAHAKRLMLAHLQAAKEQYGLEWAFAISGNIYGPNDAFDIEDGHVIPALVAKFFAASKDNTPVRIWGSGVAIRDFCFCDDTATALLALMMHLEGPVNIGSNQRHSIRDIVNSLDKVCDGKVPIEWDASKPDGQHKRYYNLDRLMSAGFEAKVTLEEGILRTYQWYSDNWPNVRGYQVS